MIFKKQMKESNLEQRKKEGLISVVVPVRDEEAVIREFYERIAKVLDDYNLLWELLFIEDSSIDQTAERIKEIAALDVRVKALFLTRNFSHHIAVTAGLDCASGEHIVIMDGDLQHRPEDIPKLLDVYFNGVDIVIGKRINQQPWMKQTGSNIANFLVNKLSDYPINLKSGMFRIISKRVNNHLYTMREKSRFLAGMIDWLGFSTEEVDIELSSRKKGKTKYKFMNSLTLALNWIFSFSTRPMRLAIYIGSTIATIGLIWGFIYIFLAVFYEKPFPGYPSIFVSILFMGGLIILLIGILAEYIARIFIEQQNRPLYVIRDKLNFIDSKKTLENK